MNKNGMEIVTAKHISYDKFNSSKYVVVSYNSGLIWLKQGLPVVPALANIAKLSIIFRHLNILYLFSIIHLF